MLIAQTAVDLVESYDVNGSVYLPEGEFNINVGASITTLNLTTNINLFGAPTTRDENDDVTTWRTSLIIDDPCNSYNPDAPKTIISYTINQTSNYNTFRVSDIEFIGYRYYNNSDEAMFQAIVCNSMLFEDYPTEGVTDFRIDHCNFQDICGSAIWLIGGESDQHSRRVCSGLVDHNRLVNTYGDIGFMTYEDRTLGYGIGLRRWACDVWEVDAEDIWGQYTNYTVVIENNYFSKWRHSVCTNDGFKAIIRYNMVNASYGHGDFDGHGSYADESRTYAVGTRCVEAYNNTFTNWDNTWGTDWAFNVRGGSWLIYNNTLDSSYGHLLDFNNDWGNYDNLAYCAINQTYVWDNSGWSSTLIHYNADSTENVNYFLYAPTGYTPYVYPHPLTVIEEGETVYYYLTVSYSSGGSTNPGAGTFSYLNGEYAYVTAIESDGYDFVSWSVDGGEGGSSNPLSVLMYANHTVHAVFVLNQTTAYSYSIDFTNQIVYVQITLNWTSTPVESENCSYAGASALTNSSGWAQFSLSGLSDFSYNSTAYPTSYPANSVSIPVAKETLIIQAVTPSFTISDLSFGSNLFVWNSTGTGEASFLVYCPYTVYYLKIDDELKVEGESWSKSGNFVTITDSLSSTSEYVLGLTSFSGETETPSGGSSYYFDDSGSDDTSYIIDVPPEGGLSVIDWLMILGAVLVGCVIVAWAIIRERD